MSERRVVIDGAYVQDVEEMIDSGTTINEIENEGTLDERVVRVIANPIDYDGFIAALNARNIPYRPDDDAG